MGQSPEAILSAALIDAGVTTGDTVLVHSDSTLSMELSGAASWGDALAFQLGCFVDVLGPCGTLIVPTFNYDFCEGKPYDQESSPSQVGLFSNFVLNHPGSVRSSHPIFSFAGIGRRANEICDGVSRSSFGADSVFDRLHKLDAGMVFFNLLFDFCTFVHYVEQAHGVDYRYMKEFSGEVARDGRTANETVDFFVRCLDRDVHPFFARLGERLDANGLLRTVTPGNGVIQHVRCGDVYQQAWEMLDGDPYSLLKRPPRPIDTTDSCAGADVV